MIVATVLIVTKKYELKSKSVCVLKVLSERFSNDYNIIKKINRSTILHNKALNVFPYKQDFDNYVYSQNIQKGTLIAIRP